MINLLKYSITLFITLIILAGCNEKPDSLQEQVKFETKEAWDAYRTYAWGHDILRPVTESYDDWYDEPLFISPIDAYSTLFIMGLDQDAAEIESYVTDSLSFDKDLYVKTFEMNIRVLGGLLSMYHLSENERVLEKAKDFGDRLMKAYDSPTGIPYYWVNLKTGETRRDSVNVAEAATNLIEMGVLSYYTGDPAYYQAAKRAANAIFDRRSELGLTHEYIDVETGEWLDEYAHIGAKIDSYYEYLYKAWLLFEDQDLLEMWETHIAAIEEHIKVEEGDDQWYPVVNAVTGETITHQVSLWDAYFPAVLKLSGHDESARKTMQTWNRIWNKHGLVPMFYNVKEDSVAGPRYVLNPEVIESAYYMWHFTEEQQYHDMLQTYFSDLKEYCKTPSGGYSSVADVRTKEKDDEMPTFFFAETMKYLYLGFGGAPEYGLDEVVFSTEAHPFVKSRFDREQVRQNLGLGI
jgi:hypothetical protein